MEALNLNTSYVKVQPALRTNVAVRTLNLNTSYVKVQPMGEWIDLEHNIFKYILC
ncbi:hypothetical protein CSCA_0692 [Clostridium scatologenes]|uniref:Uncharacterized protein n=1 Tax=Clostridium scatologenes TaxID=1548 RepID=A0A0E3JM98_CLOSL|nr:hypothetical protein CSCA_0692 [Clostridium scatologenes]